MYVFFTLLAILSCAVCVAVAEDNGFDPLADYTTFFYSTSYGAFSAASNKCQYGLIDTATNQVSFSLSCSHGSLNSSVTSNVIPAIVSNESLNSLYNCRQERLNLENSKNLANDYLVTQVKTTTSNTASITLTLNNGSYATTVAYLYECYDNTYNIGTISTSSDNFFYFVVAVDFAITFFFLFFFCS